MLRWLVVALTLLLAAFWYCASQAAFFHHGGLPASTPLTVSAVNLSSTSFTTGPAGTTVGQLSVLMSFGPFLGVTSIQTAGTDHAGAACTTAGNNFSPSGGSLVTVGNVAAGSYAGVCLVATQSNAANSPFVQAFTITANPPLTISSIALSNSTFTGGSPSGTVVGALSVAMSSGSFAGSLSIKTTGTDHSGTACTTAGSSFATSGGNLVTSGVVAAGTYAGVCVVATQANATNSPFSQAFTITGTSSGIACDQGGTFPGAVPAPAAQAGVAFNTCALYAKFSQAQYANNANWIAQCGASGVYTSWVIQAALVGGAAPCSRLNQTTDSGQTVMHVQYLTSDNPLTTDGLWELHWPNGSGNGQALPFEMFANIKFRVASASLNTNWSPAGGPVDWWMTNDRSDNTYPGWIEIDYLETFNSPPVTNWGGGTIEWNNGCQPNGACNFGNVTSYSVDLSAYHSISTLVTSDQSTILSKCTWVDGTPVGCNTLSGFTFPATWNNPNLYELAFWWGAGHSPVPTLNNNIDAYIEEIEVFVCSAYKTGRCTSSVIQSQSPFTPP